MMIFTNHWKGLFFHPAGLLFITTRRSGQKNRERAPKSPIRAVIGTNPGEFCGVKPIKRPSWHAAQKSSFRKIEVIHSPNT